MRLSRTTATVLIALSILGCRGNGETIIRTDEESLGPPSSVKVYGGQHRVRLAWQVPSLGKVSRFSVWWNQGQDSLNVPAEQTDTLIDSLAEGSYTFILAAFDSDGQASVKVVVQGKAYGKGYAGSLENRPVQLTEYNAGQKTVDIIWKDAEAGAIASQIRYTNTSGKSLTLSTPASSGGTTLENFDAAQDSIFTYRTLFLPEPEAIDTFYTAWDSVEVQDVKPRIIWSGDAESGPNVFGQFNLDGKSKVSRVNDPEYGLVWKFNKPTDSNRCESSHLSNGLHAQEGDIWYIGWRFKVDMPLNTSTNAVFQWKSYPAAQQNFPVVLKHIDGNFTLLYQNPDYESEYPWEVPTVVNTWINVVLKMKISRNEDRGYIELWYNGKQQTFDNGSTRFYARTLDDGYNDPKWGVYGASSTEITNYVSDLRIATTYELANPNL